MAANLDESPGAIPEMSHSMLEASPNPTVTVPAAKSLDPLVSEALNRAKVDPITKVPMAAIASSPPPRFMVNRAFGRFIAFLLSVVVFW